MFRAPVLGVLVGSVAVVLAQSPMTRTVVLDPVVDRVPWLTCVDATLTTVDQRVDHLATSVRTLQRGADPGSLPRVPTDTRLASCRR